MNFDPLIIHLASKPGKIGQIFSNCAAAREHRKYVAHLDTLIPQLLDRGYSFDAVEEIIGKADDMYSNISFDQWVIGIEQIARRPDLYDLEIGVTKENALTRHREQTKAYLVANLGMIPMIAESVVEEIQLRAANGNNPDDFANALSSETESVFKERNVYQRIESRRQSAASPATHLRAV